MAKHAQYDLPDSKTIENNTTYTNAIHKLDVEWAIDVCTM